VSTTTVRLDGEDEALLDMLAAEYGGRSSAIRHALRNLAADRKRQNALRSFLAEWDAEDGPIEENEIAAMAERYGMAEKFGP
jgi:Arc/MetJ-type ribon-helix-helix transcriptional regulator